MVIDSGSDNCSEVVGKVDGTEQDKADMIVVVELEDEH